MRPVLVVFGPSSRWRGRREVRSRPLPETRLRAHRPLVADRHRGEGGRERDTGRASSGHPRGQATRQTTAPEVCASLRHRSRHQPDPTRGRDRQQHVMFIPRHGGGPAALARHRWQGRGAGGCQCGYTDASWSTATMRRWPTKPSQARSRTTSRRATSAIAETARIRRRLLAMTTTRSSADEPPRLPARPATTGGRAPRAAPG